MHSANALKSNRWAGPAYRPALQHNQQKSLLSQTSKPTDHEQCRLKVPIVRIDDKSSNDAQGVSRARLHWMSLSTWWQEIMAIVLLLGATVASFATLYPYQGKPLPEWPYSITIGALLSAYSVVLRLSATFLLSEGLAQSKWRWFKSAKPLYDIVLHDNASRGPIGAFGLLWRLPFPVTWQWMGCVLAIIALLIGPFTQQVIQYEVCAVPAAKSNAIIPRSSVFMGQGTGDRRDPSAPYITLSMPEQSAVNTGVFTSGSASFTCDSGNCTFAPYSSVGYCSTCEDVSSSVRFSKIDDTTTSFIPGLVNMPIVDYAASQQVSAHGAAPVEQNFATGVQNFIGMTKIFTTLIGLPGSPTDPSTGLPPAGCGSQATNQTWRCQGYAAANCTVFPCIRTYTANVTNGVLHEQVVGTDHSALRSSSGLWFDRYTTVYGALNTSCLNDEERRILSSWNYTLEQDGQWISYNITTAEDYMEGEPFATGQESAILEQGLIDRGCLYAVDGDFDDALQSFIRDFGGNLTGLAGASKMIRSLSGSQVLQTIYNYGDFSLEHTSSLFDNMTTSLTNYMRQNPGSSEMVRGSWTYDFDSNTHSCNISLEAGTLWTPRLGQAWTSKTCVRVRWPWLALPAALAFMTLAFFIGVAVSCRALPRDVRTWKTSPLPLIFYAPEADRIGKGNEEHWSKTESQHVDDMNAAARNVNVTLYCDKVSGIVSFDQECDARSKL